MSTSAQPDGGRVILDPTGEQVLIASVEGNPVIYSTGVDQDDDGGSYHRDAREYCEDSSKIPDGDWIFFAPNE